MLLEFLLACILAALIMIAANTDELSDKFAAIMANGIATLIYGVAIFGTMKLASFAYDYIVTKIGT